VTDILFVHNNFPAQFGFLAEMLQRAGHRCAAIGSGTARTIGNMPVARWQLARGSTPGLFAPATRAEADLMRGAAAAQAALALKERGFAPALIIGHPGWGETVYLSEVFPQARQILYGEFYYRTAGAMLRSTPSSARPRSRSASVSWARTRRARSPTPMPIASSRRPASRALSSPRSTRDASRSFTKEWTSSVLLPACPGR
jgi:hypothetical protein